ncbi:hypothetical protein GIB67_017430 [Kingdonia uniflora]|uniref:Uncharacterized protein n=1 Tax=Kingdonia uniflora TaxID=39325 RepID=A0A7J7M494_9MAGN|nr:hypothetical protein GIB67_017430 [Kingdonia uniflora]
MELRRQEGIPDLEDETERRPVKKAPPILKEWVSPLDDLKVDLDIRTLLNKSTRQLLIVYKRVLFRYLKLREPHFRGIKSLVGLKKASTKSSVDYQVDESNGNLAKEISDGNRVNNNSESTGSKNNQVKGLNPSLEGEKTQVAQHQKQTYAGKLKEGIKNNFEIDFNIEDLPNLGENREFPLIEIPDTALDRGLASYKHSLVGRLDLQRISYADIKIRGTKALATQRPIKQTFREEEKVMQVKATQKQKANNSKTEAAIKFKDNCLIAQKIIHKNTDFKDLVYNCWSEDLYGAPIYVLKGKLKWLKMAIKLWNTEVFNKYKIDRNALLKEMEEAQLKLEENTQDDIVPAMVDDKIKQLDVLNLRRTVVGDRKLE